MQVFLGSLAAVSLAGVIGSKGKGGKSCFTVCFVASLAALVVTQVL